MRTLAEVDILTPDEIRLLIDLKQRILEIAPGAAIALYGSAARGERTPESDYDVLVIVATPLSRQERREIYHAIGELEIGLDVVISLAIITREQWASPVMRGAPYHAAVVRDGIAI